MKTDEEILERIKDGQSEDLLGSQRDDLIYRLPFHLAKPYLVDEAKEDEWEMESREEAFVLAEMLEYMDFAWEKANARRGLSASRSMAHMSAWLFLLGRTGAADQVLEYSHYGKPWLRAICEEFGWDWKQWDDGFWTNTEEADGVPPAETGLALAKD